MGHVQGNIKRGDILECHFGDYLQITAVDGVIAYDRCSFNTRIPHEIRKTRPVVVIGDHKGQYMVVPISSTEDTHVNPRKSGAARGYHFVLPEGELPETHFYTAGTTRWAKANMMQAVDRHRLSSIYCKIRKAHICARVSKETLRAIQVAILRSIGGSDLLTTAEDAL